MNSEYNCEGKRKAWGTCIEIVFKCVVVKGTFVGEIHRRY